MITIEDALRIAVDAHDGQKDLDGKPVILHPMAVAMAGSNREEIIAGLLHDVVEDTDWTFDDLLQRGVDVPIVEALRLLTHADGVSYEEYIGRIVTSGNSLALHVKLNDLRHNLSRNRSVVHAKVFEKHAKALSVIEPIVRTLFTVKD